MKAKHAGMVRVMRKSVPELDGLSDLDVLGRTSCRGARRHGSARTHGAGARPGSGGLDTFTIVRSEQADAGSGKLSALSPIANGLVGHVAGETVTVLTPRGSRDLRVKELLP
jgi:hypothetical protein